MYVFSIENFITGTGTCEHNESHSLENCHVKLIVLESESENGKKFLDPNPTKNEFGSTTLIWSTCMSRKIFTSKLLCTRRNMYRVAVFCCLIPMLRLEAGQRFSTVFLSLKK
jgi:hypothetical protein